MLPSADPIASPPPTSTCLQTALWGGAVALVVFVFHWRLLRKRYRLAATFEGFFGMSRNGLLIADATGHIERMNPVMEHLTGWPAKEALGKSIDEVFHFFQSADPENETPLQVDLQTEHHHEPCILRTRDNIQRYITVTSLPVTPRSGHPSSMLFLIHDISEEYKRTEQLAESQRRFQDLFNHLPDPVFVHRQVEDDPTMGFVEVNTAACAALGYTREELLSIGVVDLTPHVELHEVIQKNNFQDKPLSFCGTMITKRGKCIPAEFHTLRIQREGKWHFLTISRDISERLATENALRESEERYRLLFESASDRIALFDLDGKLIEANRFFYDALGYSKQEYQSVEWIERYHPDDIMTVEEAKKKLYSEGEVAYEFRIKHKNGTWRSMFNRVVLVRDQNKKPLYALSIIRDNTDQKQIEEQLAQSRKMESIGQLAGGIAHDFNNQLNGILGFVEILQDTPGIPEESQHHIDVINGCARRCADLTQHLLAFARKGKYRQEHIDLHNSITAVLAMLTHTIDPRITVYKDFFAERSRIIGDASQVENALLNIALNARDAMPDGGVLRFTTDTVMLDVATCRLHGETIEPGAYVRVCIRDTGIGMPDEVRQRIFDPFYTTKPIGKGTGMGLAAVYGIVRHHNGFVTVESEPGEGSAFYLFFPVAAEPTPKISSERAYDMMTKTACRVLVIEDEEASRTLLRYMLERAGYTVLDADNGKAGIDTFRKHAHEIDLVLVDMMMPYFNGAEVFRAIRGIDPTMRVIVVTGHAGDNDIVKTMLDQGLNGLLSKPIVREELYALIHAVRHDTSPHAPSPEDAS